MTITIKKILEHLIIMADKPNLHVVLVTEVISAICSVKDPELHLAAANYMHVQAAVSKLQSLVLVIVS